MVGTSLARILRTFVVALVAATGSAADLAQDAPPSAQKVWHAKAEEDLGRTASARPNAAYAIDPAKQYTLAELIDLAEEHNQGVETDA